MAAEDITELKEMRAKAWAMLEQKYGTDANFLLVKSLDQIIAEKSAPRQRDLPLPNVAKKTVVKTIDASADTIGEEGIKYFVRNMNAPTEADEIVVDLRSRGVRLPHDERSAKATISQIFRRRPEIFRSIKGSNKNKPNKWLLQKSIYEGSE